MKTFIALVIGFTIGAVFGVFMSYTPSNIEYYIENNPTSCVHWCNEQWEEYAC